MNVDFRIDPAAQAIFAAYAPVLRGRMIAAMKAAYDERLGVVTGTLRDSINVEISMPTITGGRVFLDARCTAGGIDDNGRWAWYGWFHEYGTGRFTERPNIARWVGYKDADGTWRPFNADRPAAGNGWLIMTRGEDGRPPRFLSHGLRPRHWFAHGVTKAVNVFNQIVESIRADLLLMQDVSMSLASLKRSFA